MRQFLFPILFSVIALFGTPLFASAQTCPTGQVPTNVQSPTDFTCVPDTNNPAQGANPSNPGQGANPGTTLMNPLQGGGNLQSFLLSILGFVIYIGGIAVVLMLIFVGYKFVVAQGKPGEIESAKQMLLWTLLGGLILLGSKAISLGITATVQSLGG
jgi:hypothetical protein